jgi:superfamily II DNA helicase RecQ
MELLAQKVETSLQGVETLVSNQNVIRQQLTEEREIDSKIEEKLQTLTQLCEKHSKTLNHLQESSEIQKRLNDRILVLESQLRETQNKHKKLEQLLKELPTYQELKRVKEELELFKTEAKSTFAEKEKPQLNTYPEDDQFEEENSKEIDFPQSSTLQENVSQEPLKPYGEDPYVEEVKDNHVIVDPIIPEEQESDALPWDSELTELLNAWVENHPHGWSHDEWNHLLGCMAEAGYAEFTQLNYHHEVGAYIESYRLDFISSDD